MFTADINPDLMFTLNIPLKSKARPRFANGHAYLPKDYREWQKLCRERINKIFQDNEWHQISHATHLSIHFCGHARHDLDNLIGAVLDAGASNSKGSGAWIDDRVAIFPSICATFEKSSSQQIIVKIWL
jgi:Holliday junction resolvase RusA-like endonuclease